MCTKSKIQNYPRLNSLLDDYPNAIYNSLLGCVTANKNLVVLEKYNIILRRDHRNMRGKVKIIGGGGAGVEPSEIHYVGQGMLTAAVLGEMYAAPSADVILVAIRELATPGTEGILLLVKNYPGDKLNFSLALDQALKEDIKVDMLVLGDDAMEPINESQGRQGLAGCVLIYKIAGEMAEQGYSLEEIIEECRDNILTDMATISINFGICGKTFSESLSNFIEPHEMVLGMGLYGGHGKKKIRFCNIGNAVTAVFQEFFNISKTPLQLANSNIVLLINNHGSTSKLLENIIVMETSNQLNKCGTKIELLYRGTFMSNANSHGFSITLLKICSANTLKYLEAPTVVPAWPKPVSYNTGESKQPLAFWPNVVPPSCPHKQLNEAQYKDLPPGPKISDKGVAALKQITVFASEALISCERQLNIIDSEAGDGDTGTNFRKGAESLKKAILNNELDLARPGKFLVDVGDLCCSSMGGISGALLKVFFHAAARTFQGAPEVTGEVCCAAFRSAVNAIKHYGNANLGERTVLDVLIPAVDTFESAIANGKDAIEATYLTAATCEFKADETKRLVPSWQKNLKTEKTFLYVDAGAHAATIWFRAVGEGFKLLYPNQC